MSTLVALVFVAGLTFSTVAGIAIFAAALLHLVRSAWISTAEALRHAAIRGSAIGEEISQPRARWHTP